MSQVAVDVPKGGFSFDLCRRNDMLAKMGVQQPSYRKTGTTIVGLIFKDGVILGADTRATEGPIVCDKNCEKIHYMAPNIYCCGAGTAADTEAVTAATSSLSYWSRIPGCYSLDLAQETPFQLPRSCVSCFGAWC